MTLYDWLGIAVAALLIIGGRRYLLLSLAVTGLVVALMATVPLSAPPGAHAHHMAARPPAGGR